MTGHAPHDDVGPTELDIRRRPGRGTDSTVCTLRVAADPSVLASVRDAVARDLARDGVAPDIVHDARLVASELLTNAMRHARLLPDHTIRLRWMSSPDSVEIEATDGGSATTARVEPLRVWKESGRGLRVVRALSHEWGTTHDRTGHVVWASLGGPSRRRVT